MCFSFAFMQLTLSWQQPASNSHLKWKPQPPGVRVCGYRGVTPIQWEKLFCVLMTHCLSALYFRRVEARPFRLPVFIQYASLGVLQTSPCSSISFDWQCVFAMIYNVQITITVQKPSCDNYFNLENNCRFQWFQYDFHVLWSQWSGCRAASQAGFY